MRNRFGLGGLIAALAILIVTLAGVAGGVGYANASADCVSCHRDTALDMAGRAHVGLECAQCHTPTSVLGKVQFGGAVLFGMRASFVDLRQSPALFIPNARCNACHADDLADAGAVGTAYRIDHDSCAPYGACTTCHSQTAHLSPNTKFNGLDMFDCLSCHNKTNQSVDCGTCHESRLPADRLRTGSFAVTHSAQWQQTHGMGAMSACSACHDQNRCAGCHGVGVPHAYGFQRVHGSYAVQDGSDCQSCHKEYFCSNCHGIEMPHPAGFKQVHSSQVAELGKQNCETCHVQSDCDTCHILHIHPGGAIGAGDGR